MAILKSWTASVIKGFAKVSKQLGTQSPRHALYEGFAKARRMSANKKRIMKGLGVDKYQVLQSLENDTFNHLVEERTKGNPAKRKVMGDMITDEIVNQSEFTHQGRPYNMLRTRAARRQIYKPIREHRLVSQLNRSRAERNIIKILFFSTWCFEGIYDVKKQQAKLRFKKYWYIYPNFPLELFNEMIAASEAGGLGAGSVLWRNGAMGPGNGMDGRPNAWERFAKDKKFWKNLARVEKIQDLFF